MIMNWCLGTKCDPCKPSPPPPPSPSSGGYNGAYDVVYSYQIHELIYPTSPYQGINDVIIGGGTEVSGPHAQPMASYYNGPIYTPPENFSFVSKIVIEISSSIYPGYGPVIYSTPLPAADYSTASIQTAVQQAAAHGNTYIYTQLPATPP